jgi:two-component system, response regulator PdtaR
MSNAPEIPGRPMVVVVAEDEALLRVHAVEALNGRGFVAIEAEHATAALDICKSRADEIDVLFTDIRMPGSMGGLELAHHVRERWPRISVVIASGNLLVSADELPEGARFLPKPYDMQRVVDLIHELRRRQILPTPRNLGALPSGFTLDNVLSQECPIRCIDAAGRDAVAPGTELSY